MHAKKVFLYMHLKEMKMRDELQSINEHKSSWFHTWAQLLWTLSHYNTLTDSSSFNCSDSFFGSGKPLFLLDCSCASSAAFSETSCATWTDFCCSEAVSTDNLKETLLHDYTFCYIFYLPIRHFSTFLHLFIAIIDYHPSPLHAIIPYPLYKTCCLQPHPLLFTWVPSPPCLACPPPPPPSASSTTPRPVCSAHVPLPVTQYILKQSSKYIFASVKATGCPKVLRYFWVACA